MPSWSTPQCLFCQRKSFKSTHKSICRSVWKYRSPLLRGPFFRPNAEHPLGDGFGSCRNGRAMLEMRVIGGLQEKVCAQQCLTVDLKGKLYGLCGIGVDCEATVHSSLVSNAHSQSLSVFIILFIWETCHLEFQCCIFLVGNVLKVTFIIFYNISLQKYSNLHETM